MLILRRRLPAVLLALLVTAYAVAAGSMALRRHANLESQALDMGYADQVAWNTLHGRPFRFTIFRGPTGSELGRPLVYGPGADRDSLFAYHVELLFLPISLLYLIHAGPETLIALLTAGIAAGAIPAYCIARRVLRSSWSGLAFGAMYLAFPSIQAANLSDFHAVSMAGTLLLFATQALLAGRTRWFVALAMVCCAVKEEVGLFVAALGLYAWLALGRPRQGASTALSALAWVAFCFGVVIRHFTGGAPSLFVARYADAFRRMRDFVPAVLAGHTALPVPDYTLRHLLHMLAGTGFLAAAGLPELLLAAPGLAVNGLSGSTWQHGGGAHYSAETVAGMLVAGIFGARRISRAVGRLAARRGSQVTRVPPAAAAAVIAWAGLALAMVETYHQGVLPPASRFSWPAPSEHAAHLAPLQARIPPRARVSAQSNIYPHLSTRERIYPFPSVEDAEYVLVDVAGTSAPLYPDDLFPDVQALLAGREFDLLAGDDGFLLFRRREAGAGTVQQRTSVPLAFYSFARPPTGGAAPQYVAAPAVFGDAIELAGYSVDALPEVNFSSRRVVPTYSFRARLPIGGAYRITPFLVGHDGIARIYDDGNATQLWYPTHQWAPGELVRVQFPPLTYGPGDRLGVGIQIGTAADAPRLAASSASQRAVDSGHVVLLGALP